MQITDNGMVNFCVPSEQNIFAGFSAHNMGLPVEKFIVASNNDVDRFFRNGEIGCEMSLPHSLHQWIYKYPVTLSDCCLRYLNEWAPSRASLKR